MAQVRSWASSHKGLSAALLVVAVIACLAAALGVAQATDRPSFCGSACHEMGPYHDAWTQGPHVRSLVSSATSTAEPSSESRTRHRR